MPYPLHDHVANTYLALIRTERTLSQNEETRIRVIVRNLPARITVDLLSHLRLTIHGILDTEDGSLVDGDIALLETPNRDLFFVILNRIRTALGGNSWLPIPSYLTDHTNRILHQLYDLEVNDGITTNERSHLYELTTTLLEAVTTDDDASTVVSDASTAPTEPLERTLEELTRIIDTPPPLVIHT